MLFSLSFSFISPTAPFWPSLLVPVHIPDPETFRGPWSQPSAFLCLSTFLSRDLIQSHGIYTDGLRISISSWIPDISAQLYISVGFLIGTSNFTNATPDSLLTHTHTHTHTHIWSCTVFINLCLNSSIQNLEVILSSAFFLTPNAQNNKCCRLCWERGGLIHSLLTPTWPSNERFLNGWMDEWLDRWMEEWRGG